MTRHGDEQAQVMEWCWNTLQNDQALADALGVAVTDLPGRVWPFVAPAGTQTPWVVYSAGESLDVTAVGPHDRLAVAVPLNAQVITQGADPSAGAAANRRLYALLHGTHNAPVSDGGTILTGTRLGGLSYPEDAGGVPYHHTGGLYTVFVN